VFGDLDHVGYIVRDFDDAAAWVREALGLPFARSVPLPQYGVDAAFFGRGTGTLEIFTLADAELLDARLEGVGRRLDHIAYRVDDIAETSAMLAASGARFCTPDRRQEVVEPIAIGSARVLWTVPESTGGLALQLIQPPAP
jgi:catechol 2,3-dioxygenase-like lactoylglutathione lyase family enzyme